MVELMSMAYVQDLDSRRTNRRKTNRNVEILKPNR
jgi:hypothetical protein